MKRVLALKSLIIALAVIVTLVLTAGCGADKDGQVRVITNQTGAADNEIANQNNENPDGAGDQETPNSDGSKADPKSRANDREVEGGGNSDSTGAGQAGTADTVENTGSGENNETEPANGEKDVTVIDGVTYKGYKGPVQGELKYQEGTPAAEHSGEYKASGDIESPYKVDLIVTRDFGHHKMFAKNVGLVRDEVGMEVMFRNLDIQTAYGGGFVNAINGLESGYTFFTGGDRKKHDWFYWVNGILAPVGVAEYRPQPGDVVWWDYHDWSMTMFIPAVIGSYPQPFKNGFRGKNPGTVIMYTPEYQEEAVQLKQSLEARGVKQVDVAACDPAVLKAPTKYYILLGLWEQLAADSEVLKEINEKNKFVGVYVKFGAGGLEALDFKGKTISSHHRAGAIYAYGSSIGSLKPVWVVTGTDDAGFRLALDTLLNNPGAVQQHFGAVVTEEGVMNVPYIN